MHLNDAPPDPNTAFFIARKIFGLGPDPIYLAVGPRDVGGSRREIGGCEKCRKPKRVQNGIEGGPVPIGAASRPAPAAFLYIHLDRLDQSRRGISRASSKTDHGVISPSINQTTTGSAVQFIHRRRWICNIPRESFCFIARRSDISLIP
ncbi:MAG: hypothetical protein KCHDKBKB_02383 [Elusimicrobia bacterium]|nr:hypothetical protein [Elusimicrobiota bacterium]